MLRYYITVLFRQFTETSTNENLETWGIEKVLLLNNILINGHYPQNTKYHV